LSGRVSSRSVVNTAIIEVSVEYNDPVVAARIADATMRQLGATIEDFENGTVHVALAGPAAVPSAPSNRRFAVNVALAAAAGLGMGMGIAVVLGAMNDRRGRRPRAQ
jgi:capsular polysaccharide biosynthesis protein